MIFRKIPPVLALLSLVPFISLGAAPAGPLLIHHVTIVDGTGAPGYAGAIRIEDGKIVAVGRDLAPHAAGAVLDGGGFTVAPGFIDTHSHHDQSIWENPTAPPLLSQGVTTMVVGQDGGFVHPVQELWNRLERQPVAVNVASYSGHNGLRRASMGADFKRHTTPEELARMSEMLDTDMRAGALGLSTGLGYDPGIYSSSDEVVALAQVAARHGGRYISHLRSESYELWASIDELLRVGRENRMPVQISHAKLAMVSLWGRAPEFISRLDAARAAGVDVTLDIYPYEYWQSTMKVVLPKRDFTDLAAARLALTEAMKPEGVLFGRFDADPSIVGKTLAQVAAERKIEPARLYLDLINQSLKAGAREQIIGTSMNSEDLATLLRWPFANICSDGAIDGPHPRGAGAFARVLRLFVREQRLLTLEQAVRKMSGQSADNMAFKNRGYLRPGYVADLVLFNPQTIADHATIKNPGALATGVIRVWINGQLVWDGDHPTGALPGRSIKRATAS